MGEREALETRARIVKLWQRLLGRLAAAPEAAGVRVWQITSREWSPRAGRSPPEGC